MVPNHIHYYGTAIIERVKRIIFRGNDVELPLVLNSLTMVDLNTVCIRIPDTLNTYFKKKLYGSQSREVGKKQDVLQKIN